MKKEIPYEVIMDQMQQGAAFVDMNGTLKYINDKGRKLLRIQPNAAMNVHYTNHMENFGFSGCLLGGEASQNVHIIRGKEDFVADFWPYKEGNHLKGVICLFKDDTSWQKDQVKSGFGGKIAGCSDCESFDSMILDAILNAVNEWVVVTDEFGIIRMMSNAYKDFVGDRAPEGKHVTEVIENTRLHKIIDTQIAEHGDIQVLKGHKMIASRIPIVKDGRVIGAVGRAIFKDINDFYSLSTKLNNLEKEIEFYKEELGRERYAKFTFDNVYGSTEESLAIKEMAVRASKTDSNVLIAGESGTGKELFAHAIHNLSTRKTGPFIKINCAAIPSELLESELFGYEEGAFTGARKQGKIGKFELADKGTILLDEIGDMPMSMQVKLLRLIQDREITRLGGNTSKKVDFRLIASTNCDLQGSVKAGKFREDLFYRLNVMSISLLPLRERRDEIPELCNSILLTLSERMGIFVKGISPEASEALLDYEWPGNIRELQNVLERAMNLLDDDLVIKLKHLPNNMVKKRPEGLTENRRFGTLQDAVELVEKEAIMKAMSHNKNNKQKTAKELGISRASLYQKLEKYGIE